MSAPSEPPLPSGRIVDGLWRHLGLSAPELAFIAPESLPEAYRRLLDHGAGMTATLQRRWGEVLSVELLADEMDIDERALFRFVVLRTCETGRAVELATIRIPMDRYPASLRRQFIEGLRPFGALLEEAGIRFRARPIAFFQLAADALAATKADVPEGTRLYGRISRLLGDGDEVLCETAEILPRA